MESRPVKCEIRLRGKGRKENADNGCTRGFSVIAAVKNDGGLEQCLKSECQVVFILYGSICNVSDIVKRIKERGKLAIVHVDLTAGLGSKEVAVDFIRQHTKADGIISTKPQMVKHAMELGFWESRGRLSLIPWPSPPPESRSTRSIRIWWRSCRALCPRY